MACIVAVEDANGVWVGDATVTLDDTMLVTDADGNVTFLFLDTNSLKHSLIVAAPGYVAEKATFKGPLETGEWNNSLLRRTVMPDRTILTMRLGRLDVAPTTLLADDALQKLAVAKGDAQGALLFPLPRSPSMSWPAYRFHWLEPQPVWLVDTNLLPPALVPGASGWSRFTGHAADPAADIMSRGRFFWLMHRGAPQGDNSGTTSSYAVAVWSPNINRDLPVEGLDMVVFFSPSTDGFVAKYPFGVLPGPDQQYMSLGAKYLLEQYAFTYNLIARGRQAVIVMPISPHGSWGPYETGEGLFRLCREVSLFLHRECRISNKGLLNDGRVPREKWHSGGTLRTQGEGGIYGADFGTPPAPGRVAVSGFSAGIAQVKHVMATWGLPQTFAGQQRFWGCPSLRPEGLEPKELWEAAWMELWDMDGYHAGSGGWPNYLALIKSWAFGNDTKRTRMVRLLHYLDQPDPKTDSHPTWKDLINEGTTTDNYKVPGARELQGKRWTVAHINKSYINVGTGNPLIGPDEHHATPKIAFSHFAALSPIGIPR
jgi:hypothetical protein